MPAKWQQWMPLNLDQLWSSPAVQRMSPAAFKGYLALISAQWQSDDCTIPSDMNELSIISRLSDEDWEKSSASILRKFEGVAVDRLRNDVCFAKWNEAKTIFEARQASARKVNSRSPHDDRTVTDQSPQRPADTRTLTDTYTETRTEEQKPKATPLSEKSDATRPAEFANSWNRLRGTLPKVTEFTDSRRKKIQTRQRQGISLEAFEKAVAKCASIPFLSGDNKQGWRADFDWLIENDKNLLKVLEGKYDAGESNGSVQKSRTGLEPGDTEEVIEIFRRIETGEAYAGDGKPVHR